MPHTRIQFLTQLRAALRNPIGGGALLFALACSTSNGEEHRDIRAAFQNTVEEGPAPPSQPGPAVSHSNNHSDAMPAAASDVHVTHETYHSHPTMHYCPPPAYTRWPVIGPMHRRWITHTKPHLQAHHWGYPEYFDERPFGTYVLQAEQMQVVNGLRDQQVLYNYDFGSGEHAAELKPRGEYQLRKIICRMEIAQSPIIVQMADANNPDPALDEARRQYVLEALRTAGVPATDDLVVVDRPPVPGLQAGEAVSPLPPPRPGIYNNLLLQTQKRGGEFTFDVESETLNQ